MSKAEFKDFREKQKELNKALIDLRIREMHLMGLEIKTELGEINESLEFKELCELVYKTERFLNSNHDDRRIITMAMHQLGWKFSGKTYMEINDSITVDDKTENKKYPYIVRGLGPVTYNSFRGILGLPSTLDTEK